MDRRCKRGHAFAKRMDTGIVWVNTWLTVTCVHLLGDQAVGGWQRRWDVVVELLFEVTNICVSNLENTSSNATGAHRSWTMTPSLFVLPMVLFPGEIQELRVFEPRYRQMLDTLDDVRLAW